MRRFWSCITVLLVGISTVFAQDINSSIAERKAMSKYTKSELNAKASKTARRQAKQYVKDGWEVAPGHLPLERQLDRAYQMQYEFDEQGYPKYIMSEAMSIGQNYDAAKMQALELAKLNLAGQIQSEIIGLVDNTLSNEQLSNDEAASITETVMGAKNLISAKIGRVITVVECYRDVKRNKEVRLQIAYNAEMAMEAAKTAVRQELEEKGNELHEKLDELLNL